MDAFERRACQQRRLARNAEHGGTLDHQERAQPLAAAERGIAHGVHQPLRAGDLVGLELVRQKPAQQGFGVLRGLVEALGEIEGSAGHQTGLQGENDVKPKAKSAGQSFMRRASSIAGGSLLRHKTA